MNRTFGSTGVLAPCKLEIINCGEKMRDVKTYRAPAREIKDVTEETTAEIAADTPPLTRRRRLGGAATRQKHAETDELFS